MDHLSRTSLGLWWQGSLGEEKGLKGKRKNDWEKMEPAPAGTDGRPGHIYQPFDCGHRD